MELERIQNAIDKIEPGLKKYLNIMKKIYETDVSKDIQFQKEFNGFYRMRQRKPEYYTEYYIFMENHKNINLSYEDVIRHFYDKLGRIEASFSSKLLASVNPAMPVWDEFVLQNLRLKRPVYNDKNRLEKSITLYDKICQWYQEFLCSEEAEKMISLFDSKYSNTNITNIKKIDFILWQMR